jgi:hypothetical protein
VEEGKAAPPAPVRLVQVGKKLYPELAFIQAMQDAAFDHLETAIPQGSTLRQAMRTIRDSKTIETHERVQRAALLKLIAGEAALPSPGAIVVAKFPEPQAK